MKNQKNNQILYRVIFDLVFLVGVFVLPWWVTALFLCVLLFVFETYVEIIMFALIFDIVYGVSGIFPFSKYIFTISSVGLYLLVIFLKDRIIIYR